MDLAAIAMLSIYIGLAVIPLIYNQKTYSTPQAAQQKTPATPPQPPKTLSKSIIVFLNNLTDEQIKKIMEETRTIITAQK